MTEKPSVEVEEKRKSSALTENPEENVAAQALSAEGADHSKFEELLKQMGSN